MLSVIGTWFGGIATAAAVAVALWISHRDWRRADAERRDQEKAQARLVVSRVAPSASRRVEIVNNSPTQPVLRVVPEYAVTGREDGLRGVVSPTEIVPRDVLGPGEMWSVPVMYLADDGSVGATDDYYWSQHDHDHLHRRRWASLEAGEQQRAREKARRAVVTVPPPLRPPGAARRPPRHEVGRHVVQQLHTLAVGGLQRVGARSRSTRAQRPGRPVLAVRPRGRPERLESQRRQGFLVQGTGATPDDDPPGIVGSRFVSRPPGPPTRWASS